MTEPLDELKQDTLFSLLTDLEKADSGLVEFDPEQHRDLLLKAEVKIDSYKYILTKYDSRIAEISADIDELVEVKRSLQRRQNALRQLLLWIMKEKGLSEFPGMKFVVKLMRRKKISIVMQEPDSKTFLKFPDLVKRTYCWDKKAFDKAFEKDPQSLEGYGIEDFSEYVQFVTKRGLDD
jgi:hypothetical protein